MIPTITLQGSDEIEPQHDLEEYCIRPLSMRRNEAESFIKLSLPISKYQLEKLLPKNRGDNFRLSDHFDKIFDIVHGSTQTKESLKQEI